MRYVLSPSLKRDLEEIAEWIAQETPTRALRVIRELRTAIREIAQHPKHYQLRPDIGEDARLAVAGRHVILFWIDGKVVRFERVVYGGRDLPAQFERSSPIS